MSKRPTWLPGFNAAAKQVHADAQKKGFWEEPREIGTLLMLIVSELGEALEADRTRKVSEPISRFQWYEDWEKNPSTDKMNFELYFKDTFEDELADAMIRILDLCGRLNIDIEWHINQKLAFNRTRNRKHGKAY